MPLMKPPETSVTLLGDLAASAENARWAEFVTRYRPMMEAYVRGRFPSVEADEAIAETLVALVEVFRNYRISREIDVTRLRWPHREFFG